MKLNIGSSSCHLDGWINLEYDEAYWRPNKFSGERLSSKATRDMPDVFGDAKNLKMYQNETFDEVRSSHVLEHIPQANTVATLREWFRVLKPGGTVRVIVPDLAFVIDKWINKEENKKWWDVYLNDPGLYCESELKKPFGHIDDAFVHVMYLDGHHVSGYTPDLLEYYLKVAGFTEIERCDEDEQDIPDCTVCDLSLRLKGVKP